MIRIDIVNDKRRYSEGKVAVQLHFGAGLDLNPVPRSVLRLASGVEVLDVGKIAFLPGGTGIDHVFAVR